MLKFKHTPNPVEVVTAATQMLEFGTQSEYSGFTCLFEVPYGTDDEAIERAIRGLCDFYAADDVDVSWDSGDDCYGYYSVSRYADECTDCECDGCREIMEYADGADFYCESCDSFQDTIAYRLKESE